MAIDFPPPPTPVQGELARLQADAAQGAVTVLIAGVSMHVHAPGVLDEVEIRAATRGASDLSSAVRALAASAQRRGVLAPKTLYVRSGQDIYVSLFAGTVRQVYAPARLKPYFADLAKEEPLTINAFERRRLLAGIHANRMGVSLTPVFSPAEGQAYDLSLKPGTENVSAGSARLSLSNAGNRFTGREFIDLDVRQGTPYGDEFSMLARAAAKVVGIDEVEPGSDYHELQAGWSRVNPLGLFGLSGRYLDYRQQVQGFRFNGELWMTDLNYTGVIRSTATQRLTAQGRVDYIYKQLALDANGLRLQKEAYPSLEAGLAWSTSFRLWTRSWLSLAGLNARQGLGAVGNPITRAELDYWLLRPSYTLRSQGSPWVGELQLSMQYAPDTVPEQQQWVVGGAGNLHAYVPGVAIGDRGLTARLVGEYRGIRYGALPITLKPRVFLEYGTAEYATPTAPQQRGRQSLSDVGGELALGVGPVLEASVSAAMPLSDSGVDRQVRDDARADFFFKFSGKF